MPPFPKTSLTMKKKRGTLYPVPLHEADNTKKFTYINITIMDASDAVYNMVHTKVQETHKNWIGTQKFKDMVAHNVAKTASTKIPKKVLVQKLSNKIPKMLMYQMYHKMGMRLAAQCCYREDKYAVIQIQVQYVDTTRLLATAQEEARKQNTEEEEEKGKDDDDDDDDSVATAILDEWIQEQTELMKEEQESSFVTQAQNSNTVVEETSSAVESISWKNCSNWKELVVLILGWIITKLMPVMITKEDLEHKKLPALIQKQISKEMKQMLDKKLTSKNLQAETAVLPETEQARYFYSNLQKIRTDTPTDDNNNPSSPLSSATTT